MSVAVPTDPLPPSPDAGAGRVALALGGGGARGLAHIHVLRALDDLGIRPSRISGTSIGALMGVAAASGLRACEIEDHILATLANRRLVAGRLWSSRPHSLSEFLADGGLRLGQLNAERVVPAFLPTSVPETFRELAIPMTVTTTDFFGGNECLLREGALRSAVGASAALPAVFRPVRREGVVLVDGGLSNPLPFDVFGPLAPDEIVVACDVTGAPIGTGAQLPTPTEAMFGASQLMMHAIIRAKLRCTAPDVLLQPPVSTYRVLDFLRARTIIGETADLREETKRQLDPLLSRAAALTPSRFPPESA